MCRSRRRPLDWGRLEAPIGHGSLGRAQAVASDENTEAPQSMRVSDGALKGAEFFKLPPS